MLRFEVVHRMLKTNHTEEAPFVTLQEPYPEKGPLTWQFHLAPDDADELARQLIVHATKARELVEMLEKKAIGVTPQSFICLDHSHGSEKEVWECPRRGQS